MGFVIAVVYKYADDQGGYLAALITYYAVVATFPRLLLLTTVLGVVLAGHPVLKQQVLQSALHQFPVIGDQLAQPHQLSGGAVAVVVGIAGALYGAMGGGQAVQNAMDSVWAVPRNVRPDPVRSRLRSLVLLLALGSAAIAATVLSGVANTADSFGFISTAAVMTASVATTPDLPRCVPVSTARRLTYTRCCPVHSSPRCCGSCCSGCGPPTSRTP